MYKVTKIGKRHLLKIAQRKPLPINQFILLRFYTTSEFVKGQTRFHCVLLIKVFNFSFLCSTRASLGAQFIIF